MVIMVTAVMVVMIMATMVGKKILGKQKGGIYPALFSFTPSRRASLRYEAISKLYRANLPM